MCLLPSRTDLAAVRASGRLPGGPTGNPLSHRVCRAVRAQRGNHSIAAPSLVCGQCAGALCLHALRGTARARWLRGPA